MVEWKVEAILAESARYFTRKSDKNNFGIDFLIVKLGSVFTKLDNLEERVSRKKRRLE